MQRIVLYPVATSLMFMWKLRSKSDLSSVKKFSFSAKYLSWPRKPLIFMLDFKSYNYTPTKNLLISSEIRRFCLLFAQILLAWILRAFVLTQTRPIPGNFAEVPGWFAQYFREISLDFLHCLGHEATHPLGSVSLHFVGDVGVGVQREACAVVAQDAGDRLGVYPLLNR